MPPLEEFLPYLQSIWESKWITNQGVFHQELEDALCAYLKVPYISLFTNGTLPLITAFQALQLKGEVITTPYSFVATTHALWWNGITPVFVDVDPKTGNLDPNMIEAAITPRTSAILPVHVYGNPCDTTGIQKIADKHNLRVIYDAAHAFGVERAGSSILNAGDLSTLSFHATKVYNTIEGGALVSADAETKQKIDYLKNFGFAGETKVVMPGINSKMDEVRAAYGLLNLKHLDDNIAKRAYLVGAYRQSLAGINGISFFGDFDQVRHTYSYFPIFVDETRYGMSRDALYRLLQAHGYLGRRYFYPLISSFDPYRNLPSSSPAKLPVATRFAEQVICLPLFSELLEEQIAEVIDIIKHKK